MLCMAFVTPLVNGRLLLRIHVAVPIAREQYALQPLALTSVNVHVFGGVAHRL